METTCYSLRLMWINSRQHPKSVVFGISQKYFHLFLISAMPTFQVFLNGRKIDEVVGASPDALKRLIEKNLKK